MFVTQDDGTYRFKVVPFGLVTSGASCNGMLKILLQEMNNVKSYIDDVLSHSSD